ncbi:Flavodoxin domain [Dorea longicatena]|nr:Flavodoxin domain [Dorea longicatena]
METEKYSIIFSSSTGNTKELADTIYEVLPKEKSYLVMDIYYSIL